MARSTLLEGGRLNRFIARSGLCSRRKADELIVGGLVKINGQPVNEPWVQVKATDRVTVNGRLIGTRPFVYLLMNKPRDTITTTKDERGRTCVLDLIHTDESMDGLFPVGRLDRHTTGVLLLTTDGTLGHRLMHPSYRVPKLYKVRTYMPVKPHQLDSLRKGIELDDGPARADRVAYTGDQNRCEIGIEIHEGRNRLVRRMIAALGNEVVMLERVSYAGITARGVRRGKWRRLRDHETRSLQRLVHRR